ncbi:MAG: Dihydroorotate dehydrogenase B (NAD(+)), electron transfer subunit [Planctomycetes bacterium]|nr:Dihydroorotate dehydrogenase B (NAD(+)), electron transfer subunit [Planctomycetota bacterium]
MAHEHPCSGNLAHEGTILRNVRVAADCVRLEISCPGVAAAVKAGQFVMLRARQGADPFLSRAFSVCDLLFGNGEGAPPTGFTVLILVVGVGTAALAERQPGEKIGILGPLGHPYGLGTPDETMIFVAGGIGAAPFAITTRMLRRRSASQRIVYLVGGRDADHVYLADELAAAGCAVEVATDDGSRGRKGYVTDLLVPHLERAASAPVRVLSCGPNPMFKALHRTVAAARARGLRFECQVSTEETMPCGFGACAGCVVPVATDVTPETPDGYRWAKSCVEGPVFPVEVIRWDLVRSTH